MTKDVEVQVGGTLRDQRQARVITCVLMREMTF